MTRKTILITGACGGIGRDTAIALAKRGHHVIATVHREESVEPLRTYAKKNAVDLEVFKLDITDPDDRKKITPLAIDVLINNAAIGESGSLTEIPMDRVRKNFETNVFSTLVLTQLVLQKMMEKDSGRIIFISSLAGRMPMFFWGSYSMTKYALSDAAAIMRDELQKITRKVTVSVIEPGTYHTGFNQKVVATKDTWMDQSSYFNGVIGAIKKQEAFMFKMLERNTTTLIVRKIIKAVESPKPSLRYSAPWWQAFFVRMARIFGR